MRTGGHAGDNAAGVDIPGHHRARPDECAGADRAALQDTMRRCRP